jgi:hypothetical protein
MVALEKSAFCAKSGSLVKMKMKKITVLAFIIKLTKPVNYRVIIKLPEFILVLSPQFKINTYETMESSPGLPLRLYFQLFPKVKNHLG